MSKRITEETWEEYFKREQQEREEIKAFHKKNPPRPMVKPGEQQRFPIGTKVYVDVWRGKDAQFMTHFETKCNALVLNTYSQEYGGKDTRSYALLILHENDKPHCFSAWYKEDQLFLQDKEWCRKKGERIIHEYNTRG